MEGSLDRSRSFSIGMEKRATLLAGWGVERSDDLGHAKILLPLQSVSGVIAPARPVQPKEAGQPVRTDLALQHFEGIALELLVGHVFDRRHFGGHNSEGPEGGTPWARIVLAYERSG